VSVSLKQFQATLHQCGVKSLAVFGARVRREANPASEMDLLKKCNRPKGSFERMLFTLYLEE